MFCCLKNCLNGVLAPQTVQVRREHEPIQLDTSHMGHEVVVIKGGQRACGSGGVITNIPLLQSKSYFEVKLQQSGIWSVGLATQQTDLNQSKGGYDRESWCLTSDNALYHNAKPIHKLEKKSEEPGIIETGSVILSKKDAAVSTGLVNNTGIPQEGDTIGVAFDHVELNFYLNGTNLNIPVLNIRGTVFPCLFVDDGAILDIVLDNFSFSPPPGFERILVEQSLL
ncbi:SPRY domain-containing protein 7 [Toxorhynchites rutilus septentrionalis]|uniref:SPRY domain-containing protein 7 n=1 Tax=Toxorhynchites rutilus septentrionalis TaxID=329112 RepID=UPI00247A017E|nr:SPRY domain-containing protein 7 [Toxorhynchites rutilus septentrionalis]